MISSQIILIGSVECCIATANPDITYIAQWNTYMLV